MLITQCKIKTKDLIFQWCLMTHFVLTEPEQLKKCHQCIRIAVNNEKRKKNVTIFPFECIGSCVKMDWKVK